MPKTIKHKAEPKTLPAAPIDYAGQWVAWDKVQAEIVAHGDDLETVFESAIEAGYPDAVFQKVPEADTYFIGGALLRGAR